MASKSITLTAEEMEQRIATACRSLSRKKFTPKQLKQFIVNGKVPNETKRTKSGYQLFLDDFRKDLSNEERKNVGQVAKAGAAAWKELDEDDKQPYLEKAAQLKAAAQAEQPDKKTPKAKKTPKGKKSKKVEPELSDNDDNSEDEVVEKPKKTPKGKKSKKVEPELSDKDEDSEDEVEDKPKKATKKKKNKSDEEKKPKKEKEEIDWDKWGDVEDITFTRFTCSDGKSNKFWEYAFDEEYVLIRYGKIGSKGVMQQKTFEDEQEASKFILKETAAKEKKGYEMDEE